MILGNASRGKLLATSVTEAPLGLARLAMLRRNPPSPQHAWRFAGPAFWASFARAPVDVVFVDGKQRVVAVAPSLRPWRGAGPIEGAVGGVVLEAGTCARTPVEPGDLLELTPTTGERLAAGAKPPDFPH